MRLRHAAALAIAGWYLLLAPYRASVPANPAAFRKSISPSTLYDFGTPLSTWIRQGSFNSEADCEREKDTLYRRQLDDYRQTRSDAKSSSRDKKAGFNQMARFYHAQCIGADDPHLKEK